MWRYLLVFNVGELFKYFIVLYENVNNSKIYMKLELFYIRDVSFFFYASLSNVLCELRLVCKGRSIIFRRVY